MGEWYFMTISLAFWVGMFVLYHDKYQYLRSMVDLHMRKKKTLNKIDGINDDCDDLELWHRTGLK